MNQAQLPDAVCFLEPRPIYLCKVLGNATHPPNNGMNAVGSLSTKPLPQYCCQPLPKIPICVRQCKSLEERIVLPKLKDDCRSWLRPRAAACSNVQRLVQSKQEYWNVFTLHVKKPFVIVCADKVGIANTWYAGCHLSPQPR